VKNLCCSEQDFEAPNTFGLVAVFWLGDNSMTVYCSVIGDCKSPGSLEQPALF
jgi:hypothetical protein